MKVRAACFCLLFGLWAAHATPSLAHPTALSQFDAYTGERDLSLGFAFDAIAMVELMGRLYPGTPPMDKAEVERHGDAMLRYFDKRFAVDNDGRPCHHIAPTRFAYAKERDRVLFDVRFVCDAPLGTVAIRSRLFHDEPLPHPLVGTLRHGRVLEHYFFSPGSPIATIDVPSLKPVGGGENLASRSFRTATPPPGAFDPKPAALQSTEARGFPFFLKQGLEHIYGGLDHLLFVVTLLFAARTLKDLALVITSFTLAHSITLALGAFELVRVSPVLVEPLIALSIAYVAAENILRKQPEHRARLTFLFGLVHGLGFGGALRDLGVSGTGWISALAGFNVGVELGQLSVVAVVFPVIVLVRKQPKAFHVLRTVAGAAVILLALYWFVERIRA